MAGGLDERAHFDERHAERADIVTDGLPGRMIDQRGEFGMRIVAHRAEKSLGGAVRGDRVATDPPFAERRFAFGDDQSRCCQLGQTTPLARGGEQRGAGRAAADDEQRGDRVLARPGGAARFARQDTVEGLGDHRDVGDGHRIGDGQRERPRPDRIGDRRRQDRRSSLEQRLFAKMRAEILARPDPDRCERGGNFAPTMRHRFGQQHRHELAGAALPFRLLERDALQLRAIGMLERGALVAYRVDLGELGARHHREHFGQFGVEAEQRRAAIGLETEIGHRAQPRDQVGVTRMDQPALGNRKGLGRVHRMHHRERRPRAKPAAASVARAERGGRIDHHADAVFALEPGVAVEVDRGAEGRIGQQHRDAIAIVAQQALLGFGAGGPVGRVDVADQWGQTGPQGRLRGRGEGQRGHQRVAAGGALARGLTDRDHQAERCIVDRKAGALAVEELGGRRGFERADLGAVVAEMTRRLDALQCVDMIAEPRRVGSDQGVAHGGRACLDYGPAPCGV